MKPSFENMKLATRELTETEDKELVEILLNNTEWPIHVLVKVIEDKFKAKITEAHIIRVLMKECFRLKKLVVERPDW